MKNLPEPYVARALGLTVEKVAAARRLALVKDIDWSLENSVVHYPENGLKKLISALGLAELALGEIGPENEPRDRSVPPSREESSAIEAVPQKIPSVEAVASAVAVAASASAIVAQAAAQVAQGEAEREVVELVVVRRSRGNCDSALSIGYPPSPRPQVSSAASK